MRHFSLRLLGLWLLAALALAGSPLRAELPPRPAGPVLDQAGVIPDADEAALDAKLRAYTATTGRAVIVATVSGLDDLPVEDYAQRLAESWDIGGAETEQGVLLLVAPSQRKIRIHTARGVQERLPDVLAGRIIRDAMAPRFRQDDYAGGINAAVGAITAQLDRDPAEAKAVAEAAAAASRQSGNGDEASAGSVIFWIVLIVFLVAIFGRRGQRGARRSGIDPGIVLWGISEALHHGRGHGGGFDFGGGGGGGGFGGFGGGGGGFDGGGASGDW